MQEGISRVVALAWGVASSPQRGPKRELSHERIVEVAVQIADDEGLSAVTMQRVAQAFDYSTMALYRYVSTKDDLHRLMLDAAFTDGPVLPDGDWRAKLRVWVNWLLAGYRAHPWVLEIPLGTETLVMPRHLKVAETALQAMASLPVSDEERLGLLSALTSFLRGLTEVEYRMSQPEARISEETKEFVREVVTPQRFPALATLVQQGVYFGESSAEIAAGESSPPPSLLEEDYALGIEAWLAGIDAVVAGRARPPQVVSPPRPETAAERLERAELELASGIEARKAAEQRVKLLIRDEGALRKRRDRAKEAAKAAERAARLGARES